MLNMYIVHRVRDTGLKHVAWVNGSRHVHIQGSVLTCCHVVT